MHFFRSIARFWGNLFRKRRIAVLHASDRSEEWHTHLSPAGMVAASVSILLLLFIIILTLVAYTPVLELLPGYRTEANRSHESLVQNIIRLDSMERVMNDMITYNRNIAMIMAGKSPVARTIVHSDSTRTSRILVMPSVEDSLLRAQMEGEGPYALAGDGSSSRRAIREAIELVSPVEGLVTERFNIEEGRFGVRIATTSAARVTSIDDGTVIASQWTPESGHQLVVQHRKNLVAIYKNLSQPLVTTGQAVRSGEHIGDTAQSETTDNKSFELELWSNGKAVDPEGYIVF
ncbi:MAG: peptidoglycan DD-metalloendopeptidase family protein [Alistipes sp.]|nr:peptidoglycan DD-metalloendopeptidase family protein [Alistipes sp.]